MRKRRHPDRLGLHLRVVLPDHAVLGPGRADLLEFIASTVRIHLDIDDARRFEPVVLWAGRGFDSDFFLQRGDRAQTAS